jgi:hypothetical protein
MPWIAGSALSARDAFEQRGLGQRGLVSLSNTERRPVSAQALILLRT